MVPKLEDYTVVIFSPLVIEQHAVRLMLDEVHESPERSAGQTVLYTLGKIASHNVAIAGYPVGEVGIGVSGSMASEALRDFPNLEAGILVGIAGGIPSPDRDIRLGDVAVAVPNRDSPGIIGYDLVSVGEGEVKLKQWQNSTHSILRSAIAAIQLQESRPGASFTRHLKILERETAFKRPGPILASNESLNSNTRDEPIAHYGTILSGNGVIKSKKVRGELRDKYNGIAIEMEAAGMMTRLPVAVIRGISDFAGSDKNDEWHPYAAVTAAAYAKEMLIRLGPRKQAPSASQSVIFSNAEADLWLLLPERCSFMGRKPELAKLEQWVGFDSRTLQKSVITVWGLTGVGKSQLVSEFVKLQLKRHPGCYIAWIAAATKEVFEQSILNIFKVAGGPAAAMLRYAESYREHCSMLITSFFAELKSAVNIKWLLVIDGIPSDLSVQQYIRSYLDSLPWGSIILTTRCAEVAHWYHRSVEVRGLPELDAVKLLHEDIDESLREGDDDVLDLAKMLDCHPLSLRLATSVISQYHLNVRQYVAKWKNRELYDEYLADRSVLRSFELSFEELEKTDGLAARLLMLFGYLDHRDLWVGLCLNAIDNSLPKWLRQIRDSKSFHTHYTNMRNLSFVEAKTCSKMEGQLYAIHPAIHEFARWKAKGNEEEYVKAAVSLVAAKVPRSTDKDFLEVVERLGPHAEQCRIYMRQNRGGYDLNLVELERLGNLFRHLGRYGEACRLYQGILHALNAEEKPDRLSLEMKVGIENNLGLIHHARREYNLALRAYDRSYAKQLHLSPCDNDALMMTQYNRGRALLMLGRLNEALKTLLEAATHFSPLTARRTFGNGDLHMGNNVKGQIYCRILNDIGEIHLRENNLEQAEQCFKGAFSGHIKYQHGTHPTAFAVRLNIGRVCVERSQFASANKIFEYIIGTYTAWWGRRHSETMRAVSELAESHTRHAELQYQMGDSGDLELAMAADLWAEILSFQEDVFGHSSDVATFVRQKMHQVELLQSITPEDPYRMYYSS